MKRRLLRTFLGASLIVGLLGTTLPSQACSLADGPPEELKKAMLPSIAGLVKGDAQHPITTADIKHEDLSQPQVIFLDGLGSLCEGLENAIRTSVFQIKKVFPDGMRCEYMGMVVMRGFWLNSPKVAFHSRLVKTTCSAASEGASSR